MLDGNEPERKSISFRNNLVIKDTAGRIEGLALSGAIWDNLIENERISLTAFFNTLILIIKNFPSVANPQGSDDFLTIATLCRIQKNPFDPKNLGDQAISLLHNLANGNISVSLDEIDTTQGLVLSTIVSTDMEASGSERCISLPNDIDSNFAIHQFMLNLLTSLLLEGAHLDLDSDLSDEDLTLEEYNTLSTINSFTGNLHLMMSGYAEEFIIFIQKLTEWTQQMSDFCE